MDRWWDDRADEVYWLETTGRTDFGADLNAPQLNDQGRELWSYSGVTEVRDGDVAFHYHRGSRALMAWSRGPDDYVFASATGSALTEGGAHRNAMKPAAEAAGVPWAAFQDLRRAAISRWIMAGLTPKVSSGSLATTTQRSRSTCTRRCAPATCPTVSF